MLTGMGADGADAMLRMSEAGAATIADIPIDELRAVTLAVAAGQVIWESACTEIPS